MKFKKQITFILTTIILLSSLITSPSVSAKTEYQALPKNPDYHYGIDVSKWNGDLDWAKLREEGVEFAFIRVGRFYDDGGVLDEKFAENVKACVENGIEFGVYVYSKVYKHSKVVACANWVAKQIAKLGNYTKDKDTIQVAYDIEDDRYYKLVKKGYTTNKYIHKSVLKFTDTIKSKGYVPVVYSYETFFKDLLDIDDLQEKGNKIWYARWPKISTLNVAKKKRLYNGTNPDIWQYASYYHLTGILLDTNVCYADFYDYSKEGSNLTVKGLHDSYAYTSNGVKPDVKVFDGETLLEKGKDYKLFYFSNKSGGTGRIKIVRFNNNKYIETKTIKFIIRPKPVSSLYSNSGSTAIRLNWSKIRNADHYRIYKYDIDSNKYERIGTTKNDNFRISNLQSGTDYSFKVRAVQKISNKLYLGTLSEICDTTNLKQIKFGNAVSKSKGTAKLSFAHTDNKSTGIKVYYSYNKNFKNRKTKAFNNVKGNVTISSLTSGTRCYLKIRSYYKNESDVIFSSYSDVKSLLIK